ncbi:hypothetical protein COO60DRAFT_1476220 [Scenedesmus sp. NREL 46B-D3]|nr:hypothetical protein COO60DRAFT_1476220 [Scenedesmus sp. NREL 46B-D3]
MQALQLPVTAQAASHKQPSCLVHTWLPSHHRHPPKVGTTPEHGVQHCACLCNKMAEYVMWALPQTSLRAVLAGHSHLRPGTSQAPLRQRRVCCLKKQKEPAILGHLFDATTACCRECAGKAAHPHTCVHNTDAWYACNHWPQHGVAGRVHVQWHTSPAKTACAAAALAGPQLATNLTWLHKPSGCTRLTYMVHFATTHNYFYICTCKLPACCRRRGTPSRAGHVHCASLRTPDAHSNAPGAAYIQCPLPGWLSLPAGNCCFQLHTASSSCLDGLTAACQPSAPLLWLRARCCSRASAKEPP